MCVFEYIHESTHPSFSIGKLNRPQEKKLNIYAFKYVFVFIYVNYMYTLYIYVYVYILIIIIIIICLLYFLTEEVG